MSEPVTCIIVNKDQPILGPSESFLDAHIDRLPGKVFALIGGPCAWYRDKGQGSPLLSQHVLARAVRRVPRTLGIDTLAAQDERSLAAYLRRTRSEVLLAEYGPTAVLVVSAARRAGVPLVTHFHGWDAYVLAPQPASIAAYRGVFDYSAAIVAVSRHMRDHLVQLGASPDRVIWNPCGPDVSRIQSSTPGTNQVRYLSVGRPTPKKGLPVLLAAFAMVLEAEPAARLDLIGVPNEGESAEYVRSRGIAPAVTFHGFQPHAEVLRLMRLARCYVHPSVTAPNGDMEGTPVSILEAMSAGIPVVATRHGGIQDVLGTTSAGILTDEYDATAIAEAMLEYARDPARANRDGATGRRLVVDHWSMDRSLSRLWGILQCVRLGDTVAVSHLARQDLAI